jgi:hypothetical protein
MLRGVRTIEKTSSKDLYSCALLLFSIFSLGLAGCSGLVSQASNPAPVVPSITTQPTSQTVTTGQTASFSVAATGTAPLSYQWKKSGTAMSGATSSSYTTPATTSSDNGAQFTVVVSNTTGSVTSSAATLTVNTSAVAPAITTQPASQTVTAGQTASFSVAATGTAPLSYQWMKNGTTMSGATSSSYTTPATTSSDNGAQFTVVVSNTVGSVTSNAATLTVNTSAVAPAITTQPAGQMVTAGQTASFSVAATGTAPLSYRWMKNGTAISGATSSSYTTPATTSSDNGAQFTVVVSNAAGSATSNAATLTVSAAAVAPSITTQPASQTVTAGQTASFSVAATGTAPLSYQWKKSGTAISGATSSSYTTPTTTSSDNGAQFTVVVSNAAGSATSSVATLTVSAAVVAPSITTEPASQTVTAGQTATFSVAATGTAPLSYQWRKNSAAISGATSASYTTPATTSSDNGAQFTAVVSNTAGSVTSSVATLTVSAAVVAPSITTEPASQTVTAGQTATFSVVATGTAPLSYQWEQNGTAVTGATSASYTTPATTSSDNGAQFTVVVSNTAGSVTSSPAALTVSAANAQTPTLVQHVLGPTSDSGGKNYYKLPLSMPSLSGNCMIVGVATGSLGSTVTVTDDKGNGYTQRVDVSGNEVVKLFTSATATPGVTMITASFSPAVDNVQVAASEFYNTSCVLDGTATGSGTGTTVATGPLTTAFAGDLIYQFAMQDSASGMTSWTQGTSPWALLHADIQGLIGGSGSQYQVQSTVGSITPSMTMAPSNHFDTVAIALQAAVQGTAPSGIRVVHTYHTHIDGNLPSPITMQFPSTGNAIVVIPNLVQALNFTGMSDGNNNTYSFAGPNFTNSGSGTLRIAYACSAATSTTLSGMQLTFSGRNVSGDVVILYDIAGAATACFDSTAGNPTASGTQTSLGILTGVVIAPSSANGLVFATLGQTSNTSTAATPGLFGAALDFPETTSGEMDENNGWLVYKNPDTSQITTTWTISNNGQPGGAQEWASMAAAFKAAP